jgi:hypothetical protein
MIEVHDVWRKGSSAVHAWTILQLLDNPAVYDGNSASTVSSLNHISSSIRLIVTFLTFPAVILKTIRITLHLVEILERF